MRVLRFVVLGLAVPAFAAGQAAPQAGSATSAYVVSYVEVMASSIAEAETVFRQYRDASRREAGHLRLDVMQQAGRPDHFALVELWRDGSALDAHQRAAHTTRFRDELERLRVSPYDERLNTGLAVAPTPSPAAPAGAIYVVTHADAIPTGRDEAVGLLTQWAEASRGEGGNLRFEVLQQASRQNHFTVVEIWTDQRALESHAMSARARQFRDSFQALSGALWDERLYRIVD